MRTIEIKEISLEVEKEEQQNVINKLKELYPDLQIKVEDENISVNRDFHNYKKRDMVIWILLGGKHGKI